jgi:tetratricopeptide (TPR) repeat protein
MMPLKMIIYLLIGTFAIFALSMYLSMLGPPDHIHSRDDVPKSDLDQSQNIAENIKKLEAQVQINPKDFTLIMDLGHTYLGTKQYVKGVEIFKKARQLRPQDPEVQVDLGIALRETGQIKEATDMFEKVIRSNPQYGEAWLQAAVVYRYNVKDNIKALEHFQKFLLIEPESEMTPRVKQEIEQIKIEIIK